jgi:hypothetical protein
LREVLFSDPFFGDLFHSDSRERAL